MEGAADTRRGITRGKSLISGFFKRASAYPVEQQRNDGLDSTGNRSLLGDGGHSVEERYNNKLRTLNDAAHSENTGGQKPAAEADTRVLTVPQ